MKDLLTTLDLSPGDFEYLLGRARKLKARPERAKSVLAGKSVCLYFAKPSTRTRVSFETAVIRLGGGAIVLGPNELQLGRGETIEDTARVISRYAAAFVVRTYSDADVGRFAAAASIPVINALTDGHHPCQSLADMLTLVERFGSLRHRRLAYLGDGNNVAVSLMQAACLCGVDFAIATPPEHAIDRGLVETAREVGRANGASVITTEDPEEAARGADALYTDVWVSMGDAEGERQARERLLSPYRVTRRLMDLAKPDAIFMHCLPAHRGEEVTEEVLEGPRSVVFDQAENRLHTSIAILSALVQKKLAGRPSETRPAEPEETEVTAVLG